MSDYGGMELAELELSAYEAGRRVALRQAAAYIRTWYADPNCRGMANGILALEADAPVSTKQEPRP